MQKSSLPNDYMCSNFHFQTPVYLFPYFTPSQVKEMSILILKNSINFLFLDKRVSTSLFLRIKVSLGH